MTCIISDSIEGLGIPQTANSANILLLYNGPYVVIPFILLLRMRKPLPFHRRF